MTVSWAVVDGFLCATKDGANPTRANIEISYRGTDVDDWPISECWLEWVLKYAEFRNAEHATVLEGY